jgi:predicted enzyme related to lactoylglutathione lyase
MKKLSLLLALVVSFGMGYAFSKITSGSNASPAGRVTGLGGVFFKCKDPKKMKEWYAKNLGLNIDKYGTSFEWRQATDSTKKGYTQWSAFSEKTKYFEPSTKDFMINYRVTNLDALVAQLRRDSVTILDTIERYDYGAFVHIMDIEHNKIELWEPIDNGYEKGAAGITK